MPKLFLRVIGLFLIPCLVTDPVTTAAFSHPSSARLQIARGDTTLFQEEAVVGYLASFLRPLLTRDKIEEIKSIKSLLLGTAVGGKARDLKGLQAKPANPLLQQLIREGRIYEVVLKEDRLTAEKVAFVDSYKPGEEAPPSRALKQIDEPEAVSFLTPEEQKALSKWIKKHPITRSNGKQGIKFRIVRGRAGLTWGELATTANIAHAGYRDGVIWIGELLLKEILNGKKNRPEARVLDHELQRLRDPYFLDHPDSDYGEYQSWYFPVADSVRLLDRKQDLGMQALWEILSERLKQSKGLDVETWQSLKLIWPELPARQRAYLSAEHVYAALESGDPKLLKMIWEFLTEAWSDGLPEAIHNTVAVSTGDGIFTVPEAWESALQFFVRHASVLPVDFLVHAWTWAMDVDSLAFFAAWKAFRDDTGTPSALWNALPKTVQETVLMMMLLQPQESHAMQGWEFFMRVRNTFSEHIQLGILSDALKSPHPRVVALAQKYLNPLFSDSSIPAHAVELHRLSHPPTAEEIEKLNAWVQTAQPVTVEWDDPHGLTHIESGIPFELRQEGEKTDEFRFGFFRYQTRQIPLTYIRSIIIGADALTPHLADYYRERLRAASTQEDRYRALVEIGNKRLGAASVLKDLLWALEHPLPYSERFSEEEVQNRVLTAIEQVCGAPRDQHADRETPEEKKEYRLSQTNDAPKALLEALTQTVRRIRSENTRFKALRALIALAARYPELHAEFTRALDDFIFQPPEWENPAGRLRRVSMEWFAGQEAEVSEHLPTLAAILSDAGRTGRLLFLLSVIRKQFNYNWSNGDDMGDPIGLSKCNPFQITLRELILVPESESFRRHIIYTEETDPDKKAERFIPSHELVFNFVFFASQRVRSHPITIHWADPVSGMRSYTGRITGMKTRPNAFGVFLEGLTEVIPLSAIQYVDLSPSRRWAVELKIPGEDPGREMIWPIHTELAARMWEAYGSDPEGPGVIKPSFFLSLEGDGAMYEKPSHTWYNIAAFQYEDGKRLSNTSNTWAAREYFKFMASTHYTSMEEFYRSLIRDTIVASVRMHHLGYTNSIDMHDENLRLLETGRVVLAADFGVAKYVGKVSAEERQRELERLIDDPALDHEDLDKIFRRLMITEKTPEARARILDGAIDEMDLSHILPTLKTALTDVIEGRSTTPLEDLFQNKILEGVLHGVAPKATGKREFNAGDMKRAAARMQTIIENHPALRNEVLTILKNIQQHIDLLDHPEARYAPFKNLPDELKKEVLRLLAAAGMALEFFDPEHRDSLLYLLSDQAAEFGEAFKDLRMTAHQTIARLVEFKEAQSGLELEKLPEDKLVPLSDGERVTKLMLRHMLQLKQVIFLYGQWSRRAPADQRGETPKETYDAVRPVVALPVALWVLGGAYDNPALLWAGAILLVVMAATIFIWRFGLPRLAAWRTNPVITKTRYGNHFILQATVRGRIVGTAEYESSISSEISRMQFENFEAGLALIRYILKETLAEKGSYLYVHAQGSDDAHEGTLSFYSSVEDYLHFPFESLVHRDGTLTDIPFFDLTKPLAGIDQDDPRASSMTGYYSQSSAKKAQGIFGSAKQLTEFGYRLGFEDIPDGTGTQITKQIVRGPDGRFWLHLHLWKGLMELPESVHILLNHDGTLSKEFMVESVSRGGYLSGALPADTAEWILREAVRLAAPYQEQIRNEIRAQLADAASLNTSLGMTVTPGEERLLNFPPVPSEAWELDTRGQPSQRVRRNPYTGFLVMYVADLPQAALAHLPELVRSEKYKLFRKRGSQHLPEQEKLAQELVAELKAFTILAAAPSTQERGDGTPSSSNGGRTSPVKNTSTQGAFFLEPILAIVPLAAAGLTFFAIPDISFSHFFAGLAITAGTTALFASRSYLANKLAPKAEETSEQKWKRISGVYRPVTAFTFVAMYMASIELAKAGIDGGKALWMVGLPVLASIIEKGIAGGVPESHKTLRRVILIVSGVIWVGLVLSCVVDVGGLKHLWPMLFFAAPAAVVLGRQENYPKSDLWEVVGITPDEYGHLYTARPLKRVWDSDGVNYEDNDLGKTFELYSEYLRRFGFTRNIDGTLSYPDLQGLNNRFARFGIPIDFYSASSLVSPEEYLKGFAPEQHMNVPIALTGSDHFHDMFVHVFGYTLFSIELLRVLNPPAAFIQGVLDDPLLRQNKKLREKAVALRNTQASRLDEVSPYLWDMTQDLSGPVTEKNIRHSLLSAYLPRDVRYSKKVLSRWWMRLTPVERHRLDELAQKSTQGSLPLSQVPEILEHTFNQRLFGIESIPDEVPEQKKSQGIAFLEPLLAIVAAAWPWLLHHPILFGVFLLSLLPISLAARDVLRPHVPADIPHSAFHVHEIYFREQMRFFQITRLAGPLACAVLAIATDLATRGGVFVGIAIMQVSIFVANKFMWLPEFKALVNRVQDPNRLIRYVNFDLSKNLRALAEDENSRLIDVVQALPSEDLQIRAVGYQWIFKGGKLQHSFVLWFEEPDFLHWLGLFFPIVVFIAPTSNWRSVAGRLKDFAKTATRVLPKPAPAPQALLAFRAAA